MGAEVTPAFTIRLGTDEIVGGPFVTVSKKLDSANMPSVSVTRTKTLDAPIWLVWGSTRRVRLVPDPEKVIPVVATKAGFDELAESTRFVAGVSTSHTVKGIKGVLVLAATLRSAIPEMKGG